MIDDWRQLANCRREPDKTIFDEMTPAEHSVVSRKQVYPDRIQLALEYCEWCPVKSQCLADAASSTEILITGVRGGQYLTAKAATWNRATARKAAGLYNKQKLSTHCRAHHEFTPINTYIDGQGTRHCRRCNRDQKRLDRAA